MSHLKVKIQNNFFESIDRPTTQEDNFGGIVERWDLYPFERHTSIGKLVKFDNGNFAVIHDIVATGNNGSTYEEIVRYEVLGSDVQFLSL